MNCRIGIITKFEKIQLPMRWVFGRGPHANDGIRMGTHANGGIRKGPPFNFHLHKQKYHHCLGQLWQTQIP